MTLSLVRTALETALATIAGLTVYKEIPDVIAKLPCAIVSTDSGDYEVVVSKASIAWRFRILLAVGERDSKTAHATLDGYLALTGSTSILAAIEGTAIGDFARVRRVENVGFISYRGTTYIGAEFIVDVTDT